ncbi:glycosyltransferase family 2 protein [Candidatus Beckwithbacteria bacterium]|nr:glycosyltransferase family 2 protein [Candidatus Beckwithbacteria bacterium]
MKLSVIITTHNEEQMLPKCLESVAWADEIIVCDKKSTDSTLAIAKKTKAKICHFTGEHFDKWRNEALKHASGEWVLYLDPDERITSELKQEILEAIKNDEFAAYQLARKNYWWGEEFKVCGAWPDYVTHLIKKEALQDWQGIIHESPIIIGEIGTLQNPLIHLTHRDLESGLKKSYEWTKMEAQLFVKAKHPPITWWRLAKVTLSAFLKKYLVQGGYKAGTAGFVESAVQAWNRFMVYEQIWEMQQNPSLEGKYFKIDKSQ